MLNRSIAPDFQPIGELSLVCPESYDFDNGLKTFVFKSPDLQLIKLELVFDNVLHACKDPMLNTVMAAMLKEGTTNRSSADIANQIDFYGAFLMPEYSFDHTALTVYTMHKYVDQVLPIVRDILTNSVFPQQELATYVRNNKQSLQISLQKNDVVARRLFYQHVFDGTSYGVVPTAESYDAITQERLKSLYERQIRPDNCTLFIAGNVDEHVLDAVKRNFVNEWKLTKKDAIAETVATVFQPNEEKLIVEQKEDALQSAIRMGGLIVNRAHPDFPAVQFVNTLLGGFFGSRLMRNIREEKGYTYSIGSAIAHLKDTGFFTLASEVGVDVTRAAVREIALEFDKLRQERCSDEEIDLVRNYMQGVMLGSLESIFSHVDKFKSVYFSNLDLSYYRYYSQVLENMTPEKVQDIAIRYFDYEKLTKIIVGKLQ